VNQAISEKKIVIFLFSQESLISQVEFSISFTMSEETYSESACDNSFLFLSSFLYFNID